MRDEVIRKWDGGEVITRDRCDHNKVSELVWYETGWSPGNVHFRVGGSCEKEIRQRFNCL